MNLRDHLNTLDAAAKRDLASRAGTEVIYLIQIAGGHSRPSPRLCIAIERATQGAVTRYDLRDDAEQFWPLETTESGRPRSSATRRRRPARRERREG